MAVGIGEIPDFVDHQQLRARIVAQAASQCGIAIERAKVAEQLARAGEQDRVPLDQRLVSDVLRQGRLADAVGTDDDDIGGLLEEVERHPPRVSPSQPQRARPPANGTHSSTKSSRKPPLRQPRSVGRCPSLKASSRRLNADSRRRRHADAAAIVCVRTIRRSDAPPLICTAPLNMHSADGRVGALKTVLAHYRGKVLSPADAASVI